jgi:hypothetical protein
MLKTNTQEGTVPLVHISRDTNYLHHSLAIHVARFQKEMQHAITSLSVFFWFGLYKIGPWRKFVSTSLAETISRLADQTLADTRSWRTRVQVMGGCLLLIQTTLHYYQYAHKYRLCKGWM